MSDYWEPGSIHCLLNEHYEAEIPELLVERGMILPGNKGQVAEVLSEHQLGWFETEYDAYCKCGKWLEIGCYDIEDHQAQVLDDEGLIVKTRPGETDLAD